MSADKQQNGNVFKYSNTEYTFQTTLRNNIDKPNANFVECLDNSDIVSFTYISQLNDLVVKAKLEYIDKYSYIDKMIGQFELFLDVRFSENFRPHDPSNSWGEPDPDRTLNMSFLVQNVRPVNRVANCIQYELELVSTNWYKCIANTQYSNHAKDPEPILDIFKACLTQQGLVANKDSFANAKQDVSMNYVTSQNDNIFTIANYLFHKLYYLPQKDQSMKFFVWDMFTHEYHIVDMSDKNSFIGAMTNTVLSFFKSNAELLMQQEATNIGSFAHPTSRTSLYEAMFEKKMQAFDFNTNKFVAVDMMSKELNSFANNNFDQEQFINKYLEVEDIMPSKCFQSGTYWDNDMNVYGDLVNSIVQNDSIVLNITGDVLRQSGAILNIGIDRDMGALTSDKASELRTLKTKYKQYEGPWAISKAISIVKPKAEIFRQQIALFRNFMPIQKIAKMPEYGVE